jgi:hypothetical protein
LTSEQLTSEVFAQLTKGHAQMRLAKLGTAREAVVWAFQGADNIIAAVLSEVHTEFNKKNHKDKWDKFFDLFPEFEPHVTRDQVEECRRKWESARYRGARITSQDAGLVVATAHAVFEFCLDSQQERLFQS